MVAQTGAVSARWRETGGEGAALSLKTFVHALSGAEMFDRLRGFCLDLLVLKSSRFAKFRERQLSVPSGVVGTDLRSLKPREPLPEGVPEPDSPVTAFFSFGLSENCLE